MVRPALVWQVSPLVLYLIFLKLYEQLVLYFFQVACCRSSLFVPTCRGWVWPRRSAKTRFQLDRSLLSALVDRWRPETHTFHLPCGEMAPTLQDITYLLGLPLFGSAVGPRVVPPTWLDDLEARFTDVDRMAVAGPLEPHPRDGR